MAIYCLRRYQRVKARVVHDDGLGFRIHSAIVGSGAVQANGQMEIRAGACWPALRERHLHMRLRRVGIVPRNVDSERCSDMVVSRQSGIE